MIALKNLTKKYNGSAIFDNASFSFPDKGLICVLGPSGCGKTTLLNLLAGFDSQYSGDITVHGTSLSGMDAAQLSAYRRDNIGFVFQNYHLLGGYTTLENVLLAADALGTDRRESEPKARALLEQLGLAEKAAQKIETLSGGQKQRAAIARALVGDPSIILADEPTGALDRNNSAEIMALLRKLSEERLVIVITHDIKCAECSSQTVTISDGQLHCEVPIPDTPASTKLRTNRTPKISLWKRACKNFRVHLPRYIAVALAVSIGVLCFALSLSSRNIMARSIGDFEAKNTAYHNGFIKTNGNEAEILTLLSQDSRIDNAYAQYILTDISIKIGTQTILLPEKYPSAKAVQQLSYGVMPRFGQNEIAISPSMASKFDRNIQALIGAPVELTYNGQTYSLTVSGIFNAVYDDCFVSSDIERKMTDGLSGAAYSVSYDVIRFEDIVPVSSGLDAQNITGQNASAEVAAFLDTFQNLHRLFLTVSILILVIGIFISAVLLVKQQNTRYREVGLLSALGYPKGSIQKLLLYENIGLSALSVLCSGILTAFAQIIGKLSGTAPAFSPWQIALTLSSAAALILLISLPASRALVITEPADALRK